jgi:hypothetical protein
MSPGVGKSGLNTVSKRDRGQLPLWPTSGTPYFDVVVFNLQRKREKQRPKMGRKEKARNGGERGVLVLPEASLNIL